MLGMVVRINGEELESPTGEQRGRHGHLGTGFCVRAPSKANPTGSQGYVVTAHHVIDGQPKPELVFPNTNEPGILYPPVTTEGPDWMQPLEDVDLAVLPFEPPKGYLLTALDIDYHLYEHLPSEMLLALPFHYVGLLEPLNRSMARSGTLGAVYQGGIKHPDGYRYAAHLGDGRTYAGFSGSPCFSEMAYPLLVGKGLPPFFSEAEEQGPIGRIRYLHLLCGMVTYHVERALEGREASAFGVICMLTSDDIWRGLSVNEMRRARASTSGE
jgi:hypothetical protein